ncbi:MAG: hypothetical protein ACC707_16230 [Thiohalomonadales bacterium]
MNKFTVLFILFFSFYISACGGDNGSEGGGSPVNIGTKSISVGWEITETRVNGDLLKLSAIGGYKLYVTTNSSVIPARPHTTITDASITSYTLNDLSPATYYIYLTTYDINGDESPYSDRIKITI